MSVLAAEDFSDFVTGLERVFCRGRRKKEKPFLSLVTGKDAAEYVSCRGEYGGRKKALCCVAFSIEDGQEGLAAFRRARYRARFCVLSGR